MSNQKHRHHHHSSTKTRTESPPAPVPIYQQGCGVQFGDEDIDDGDDAGAWNMGGAPSAPSNVHFIGTPAAAASADEPELVPVMHPADLDIETRLGPTVPEDAHCYICNVVDQSDPGKMSDDVVELMNFIDAGRRTSGDMVKFAARVKAQFDARIRTPTNVIVNAQHTPGTVTPPPVGEDDVFLCETSTPTPTATVQVAEWTLRSIYNHIVHRDMSPGAQLDRGAALIDSMLDVLRRGGVFVADKTVLKPDNTAEMKNVQVGDRACAKVVALLRTSLAFNRARMEQFGGIAMRAPTGSSGTSNGSRGPGAITSANMKRVGGSNSKVLKRPAGAPSSTIAALNNPGNGTNRPVRTMFN
jgi:hypothetical protein